MDERAFADLVDAHGAEVLGFLAYRVGSRPDAEDLCQLVFERAWRSWSRFDPARASPRTWLLAIARNVAIDHFRGRGGARRDWLELEAVPEAALPAVHDEPRLPDLDLQAALAVLRPRERELLALRYGADLGGPEIAALLGLSLGNAQQIHSRALKHLREALGEPNRL